MNATQELSPCCKGERCTLCGEPAARKVAEEILYYPDASPFDTRHPYTAYVCLKHFGQIMGFPDPLGHTTAGAPVFDVSNIPGKTTPERPGMCSDWDRAADELTAEAERLGMYGAPLPHQEKLDATLEKLAKMTPSEIVQKSVATGIHSPDGGLTEQYQQPDCDNRPPGPVRKPCPTHGTRLYCADCDGCREWYELDSEQPPMPPAKMPSQRLHEIRDQMRELERRYDVDTLTVVGRYLDEQHERNASK